MAGIKFSCPGCQQHIEAESGYAGMQINCPVCKGAMIVPGQAAAQIVTEVSQLKVSAMAERPSGAAATACPSCGGGIENGAVICTACGYNTVTRKKLAVTPGKRSSAAKEKAWYANPLLYFGLVVVTALVFWFLGRSNPSMQTVFSVVVVGYYLIARLIVLVAAFSEGKMTGFLTLFLPIYDLYFVFMVNENRTLKRLYSTAVSLVVFMKVVGTE